MEPLTKAEERELEGRMNQLQIRQFIGFFGGAVEKCFTACVDEFTTKSMSSRETACVSRCVAKTVATQQRLRDRFDEQQAAVVQEMQKQQQGGGLNLG